MTSPDPKSLVVVGAGIVGVCCALQLLRDGHRVTLIDRAGPGEGTSFGNASVIEPHGIIPVPTPGVLWQVPKYLLDPLGPLAIRWSYLPKLAPWLARFVWNSRPAQVRRNMAALDAILKPTIESYRDLVKWAGAEDMLREQGWLAVAESPGAWKNTLAGVEIYRAHGVPLTVLKPEEVRQYEPAFQAKVEGAVFFPKVAHVINNFRFVQMLAGAAHRLGAALARDEVVDFERGEGGRVAAVRSRDKRYPCDGVVIAGGAWSKALTEKLGYRPPLDTERGYHITVPKPGFELRLPVLSTDRGFVATPLEIGLRVAGTDELGGLKLPPNWERAESIRRNVRRWFPQLNDEGYSRWMGFRPSLPDSVPVIGPVPKVPNAWLAFGHGHLGLTMGARTGQLIADQVAGRASDIDLKPYRAGRF
jgi:D-amino-acid dehydrogenase